MKNELKNLWQIITMKDYRDARRTASHRAEWAQWAEKEALANAAYTASQKAVAND